MVLNNFGLAAQKQESKDYYNFNSQPAANRFSEICISVNEENN